MKKIAGAAWLLVLAGGGVWLVISYAENIAGLGPAILPPIGIKGNSGNADIPLELPPGFSISVFAEDLPGARDMEMDALGNIWVSQTSEGRITMIEIQQGKLVSRETVFEGLDKPHGLAFHPQHSELLYIAEQGKVSRVFIDSKDRPEKLFGLPSGGHHFTRSILFGQDDKLYTSVGSTCNACEESDWRRAAVLVSDDEGNNLEVFAAGLRNAVFLSANSITGDIWVTEMGRDFLGDDLPPDEINILQEGGDYGWPVCYGKNVPDVSYARNASCARLLPSHIDLPAHVAPLGLDFITEDASADSGWPEEYRHDVLIAYHGSWNRSEPVGYKVVRLKLDEHGDYKGSEDFAAGWLRNGRTLGRPVDILVESGGIVYISDDKAGRIYKIVYEGT